jgi:Zn-dependent peptidase ImmA (M78 family)
MERQILKLDANPKIVEWAIKTSGWELNILLTKIDVSENTYKKWIVGSDKPTLKQLKLISWKTKRPLALFFLDKIPQEKPLPKDYRLNPEKEGKFDKKTIFAIRKSRKFQSILKDFGENGFGEILKEAKISINDSPQGLAKDLREKFDLTEEFQRKGDSYKFFKFLRNKLEEEKIFNFQISMPLEDARGFALSDEFPRVIVVNSGDIIEARIFTLIHELGHILLGDTEISIPNFKDTNKTERWCNEFASAFLLPPEMAKKIFEENDATLIEYETLKRLSRKYKVSKSMLLYKMVKLNFITSADYGEFLNRFTQKEYAERANTSGGGVSAEKKCLSELGTSFISLVADNMDRKTITYSDALDYLSIKSGSFGKLINKL